MYGHFKRSEGTPLGKKVSLTIPFKKLSIPRQMIRLFFIVLFLVGLVSLVPRLLPVGLIALGVFLVFMGLRVLWLLFRVEFYVG